MAMKNKFTPTKKEPRVVAAISHFQLMHQHATIMPYWRLAISDIALGVNFRAESVWIFQLRFDSVFNLK